MKVNSNPDAFINCLANFREFTNNESDLTSLIKSLIGVQVTPDNRDDIINSIKNRNYKFSFNSSLYTFGGIPQEEEKIDNPCVVSESDYW